jgi:hypothetical protein
MFNISPDDVPEFLDLVHFTEWYLTAGMPILLPKNKEVFLSDDATATCLFRHGRYQFEMYFIHPNPLIPMHLHPGVENIEISSCDWGTLSRDALQSRLQREDQPHGKTIQERAKSAGFALFSAQKWDEGIQISTIGARWKGPTAGPMHDALIRRFNPDCLSYAGYADVTLKQPVADAVM